MTDISRENSIIFRIFCKIDRTSFIVEYNKFWKIKYIYASEKNSWIFKNFLSAQNLNYNQLTFNKIASNRIAVTILKNKISHQCDEDW